MIDFTSAHGFCATSLGAFDKIAIEQNGTFTDADQAQLLIDEYKLAIAVAIAGKGSSMLVDEHGHSSDASTMIRAYYFALALNTLEYDLEHYLPGVPVHVLGL